MKRISYLGSIAATMLATTLGACAEEPKVGSGGPNIEVNVAPLDLANIASITFHITMEYDDPSTPPGDWVQVWDTYTTGNPYGNGTQYIGPCVAGAPGINRVTVAIVQALDTNGDPVQDLPAPAVNSSFPCEESKDTPVDFEFTLIHEAGQGFTDITYDIDELFCSMKGDCLDAFLPDNSPSGGVTVPGECSDGYACAPNEVCWDGTMCPATAEVLGACLLNPATACDVDSNCTTTNACAYQKHCTLNPAVDCTTNPAVCADTTGTCDVPGVCPLDAAGVCDDATGTCSGGTCNTTATCSLPGGTCTYPDATCKLETTGTCERVTELHCITAASADLGPQGCANVNDSCSDGQGALGTCQVVAMPGVVCSAAGAYVAGSGCDTADDVGHPCGGIQTGTCDTYTASCSNTAGTCQPGQLLCTAPCTAGTTGTCDADGTTPCTGDGTLCTIDDNSCVQDNTGTCLFGTVNGNPIICDNTDLVCPGDSCQGYQAGQAGTCAPESCLTGADCPTGETCDGVITTTGHIQGDRAPTLVTAIACTGGGDDNVTTEVGMHNAILCCGTDGVIDPDLEGCVSLKEAAGGNFPAADVNPIGDAEFYDGSETIENKEFSNTAWQLDIDWLEAHQGDTCIFVAQAYVNWTEDGVTAPATTYVPGSVSFGWHQEFTIGKPGTPFSTWCGEFKPKPIYKDWFRAFDPNNGRDINGKATLERVNKVMYLTQSQLAKWSEDLGAEVYSLDRSEGEPYKDFVDIQAINLAIPNQETAALELFVNNVRKINGTLIADPSPYIESIELLQWNAEAGDFELVKNDFYQTKVSMKEGLARIYINNALALKDYYVRITGQGPVLYDVWFQAGPAAVDSNPDPRIGYSTEWGYLTLNYPVVYSEMVGETEPVLDYYDTVRFQPTLAAKFLSATLVSKKVDGYELQAYDCGGKRLESTTDIAIDAKLVEQCSRNGGVGFYFRYGIKDPQKFSPHIWQIEVIASDKAGAQLNER